MRYISDLTIKQKPEQYWTFIKKGMLVEFCPIKKNPNNIIKEGLVEEILTKKLFNPSGIIIKTMTGEVGHVIKIKNQVYTDKIILSNGNYKEIKKNIKKLLKLPIDIVLDNNIEVKWEHLYNKDNNNSLIKVLLNDAKYRQNHVTDITPPKAIFYLFNKKIIGLEYYNYNGILTYNFKNNNYFNNK